MKNIIVTSLLIMSGTASFAQIQRNVEKQKPDTVQTEALASKENASRKEMFRELDLSKEQRIKMKEINQSMKASRDSINNDTTLTGEVKKEKLKSLRKEQAGKIQAILTPEQKIKFREMQGRKEQR